MSKTQSPQTFSPTRGGALALLVGHDPDFPNDSDFALNEWTKYKHENSATHITGGLVA